MDVKHHVYSFSLLIVCTVSALTVLYCKAAMKQTNKTDKNKSLQNWTHLIKPPQPLPPQKCVHAHARTMSTLFFGDSDGAEWGAGEGRGRGEGGRGQRGVCIFSNGSTTAKNRMKMRGKVGPKGRSEGSCPR